MTFDLEFQLRFSMASKGSVGVYVPSNFKCISTTGHGHVCCHCNRTQLQFALCDVHCSLEMQCCPRWTTAVLHPALSAVTKATQPLPMAWQKNKLNLQNENMVMLWDTERAKCLLGNFKIALEEINYTISNRHIYAGDPTDSHIHYI